MVPMTLKLLPSAEMWSRVAVTVESAFRVTLSAKNPAAPSACVASPTRLAVVALLGAVTVPYSAVAPAGLIV